MIRFKRHIKLIIFLCALIIAILIFGYLKWTSPKVLSIGIYAGSSWDVPSGQENTLLDDVIKRFEEGHPNVRVKYESGITKEAYSDWLSDRIVQGSQPDVFIIPENDFNLLASTGSLLNLEKNIRRTIDTSMYYTASIKAGQYRDVSYALPFESNPILMCINRDLLESQGIEIPQSGWTTEEFFQLCQRLTKDTDGDGVIDQFGTVGYSWKNAVAANGISLFLNDGSQVDINTTQIRDVLTWYHQLEKLSGNYTVAPSDFDKGKVAFMPMTLAEYRTYKPYPYHVLKYSSFSWSCIEMPRKPTVKSTEMQTSLFGISSKTKQPQLAWEFLKMLSADEQTQQDLFAQSQGASVLKSVMTSQKSSEILQNDTFGTSALSSRTLNHILESAQAPPNFPSYNDLIERADYLIGQSLSKDSIDSDLGEIQEELSRELRN
ncbi:ABC transporter substrate-binding protein [Streptococcus sp. S784/96/1]|uniref:ABC transporter substrate-binding protein n=1 Tax=Streptococcus sp. S784/96/1 TaxID=2653499 RepID=UPI001389E654|nr:extracellular solute-binding protein [Streptococcus sp. S784/96/1]